ncbi:MAG: gamma-glutamylcyclotransferase family protein [Pseudomonadota bacterium]|nr:gamma-glutamylcyclotransferase family protein [Pseudomonadota bacterium]
MNAMHKKIKKLIIFCLFFSIGGVSISAEYDPGGKNPDNDDVIYYFGYGSNLDEDYMRQWTPSLKFVSLARLPNFEIQFRKYSTDLKGGISSIIEKPGGMVQGVIYTIKKSEMEALDILEDVPLGIYKRETFKVITEDGIWYNADLYRVVTPKGPFIPSVKYLGYMIKGAKAQGINQPWIDYLEALREEIINTN